VRNNLPEPQDMIFSSVTAGIKIIET